MSTKKTYKAPLFKAISIVPTALLVNTSINTGKTPPEENGYYEEIFGYDWEQGGWGTGSPD